mgnify:FL=1
MPLLAINGKPVSQTASVNAVSINKPASFTLGMIQPTVQGIGQIQIIPSKQSLTKTAEPTKPEKQVYRVK